MESREQIIARDRSQHQARIERLKQEAGLGPVFRKINPQSNGQSSPNVEIRTDMAPGASGTVIRKRRGVPRTIPVVLQSGFDEKTEPADQHQAANYKGDLKRLTPIEEELRQSTEGHIDPQVADKARKQRFAVSANSRPK